jgi:hypothetical protein
MTSQADDVTIRAYELTTLLAATRQQRKVELTAIERLQAKAAGRTRATQYAIERRQGRVRDLTEAIDAALVALGHAPVALGDAQAEAINAAYFDGTEVPGTW